MATNADPVADDNQTVTEDDLRALKYPKDGVEPSQEEDETIDEAEDEETTEETSDDGQTEETPSEEQPTAPAFVKEFTYIKGDTPEEYAKNLEIAYKNSTTEALRLKGELDKTPPPVTPPAPTTPNTEEPTVPAPTTATDLWVQQQLDKEIQDAFRGTQKEYPQVNNQADYDRFTSRVRVLSQTILAEEKRLASPAELYNAAAVSLGWQKQSVPDSQDKLGMALKDNASATKVGSAAGKAAPKTKVSQAMIELNRKMYPGKTDDEIRTELEEYIQ